MHMQGCPWPKTQKKTLSSCGLCTILDKGERDRGLGLPRESRQFLRPLLLNNQLESTSRRADLRVAKRWSSAQPFLSLLTKNSVLSWGQFLNHFSNTLGQLQAHNCSVCSPPPRIPVLHPQNYCCYPNTAPGDKNVTKQSSSRVLGCYFPCHHSR